MRWPWSGEGDVLGINRRNLDLVFAGHRPGKFRMLDDKLQAKERLESNGIPVPRTLTVISGLSESGKLDEILAEHDEFVIKPARGSRGRGILVLRRDGDVWATPGGRQFDHDGLLAHCLDVFDGIYSLDEAPDKVIVERRVHPHPWVRELFRRGLSDLRIVVEDHKPLQAMLRVPTEASDGRANLHEGGIGLGIDLQSGRAVHAVQRGVVVSRHPDTGRELIGDQVPDFDRCLELARKVGEAFPEVRYLGVDLVLDEERGPLVLEVNARPGLAIQIANQDPQRVRRRTRPARFDRVTQRAAWIVMILLGAAPTAYALWRGSSDTVVESVQASRVTPAETTAEAGADAAGVEWSDEADPLSSRDERFAEALRAVAEGDTTRAIALYNEASADSALTPFALNNIALIQRSRGHSTEARDVLMLALEHYPRYARGYYNLGLIQRDLHNDAAAVNCFRRALELRPSHARSWSGLGELLSRSGQWDRAVEALDQAVRFDPDRIGDRRLLGDALMNLDRPGAAAKRFQEVLSLDPDSRHARNGYVRARLDQARRDQTLLAETAIDSLELVLGRRRSNTASGVERTKLRAELRWWQDNPRSALRRLAALPKTATGPAPLQLRALLQLELGLWRPVIEAPETPGLERLRSAALWADYLESSGSRSSATDGDNRPEIATRIDPVVHLLALKASGEPIATEERDAALAAAVDAGERSWVEWMTGNTSRPFAPAVTPLRLPRGNARPPLPTSFLAWTLAKLGLADDTVLERIHPDHVPRLREQFATAIEGGETKLAHTLGMRLLRSRPDDAAVVIPLAGLELDRGKPDLARTMFDRIHAGERSRPDARLVEARLLLAERRPKSARKILEQLLDQDPAQIDALVILSDVQRRLKDRDDAIVSLRNALALAPNRTDLRIRIARTLMEERMYPEAEVEWNRLATLQTDTETRKSILFNLALARQRADRLEDALSVWNMLVALDPAYSSAQFNRALALERLQRYDAARAGYLRVLEIEPGHAGARSHLDGLPVAEKDSR